LRIITGTYKNVLVLPRKALVYNNKQEISVFLIEKSKDKKETVKKITVQTGAEELGYITITKGLKKGDRVVLTGKESLKNGEPVTTS
jgi:multidrug efflux pump subunit AcrA (membrane-fusion protein)